MKKPLCVIFIMSMLAIVNHVYAAETETVLWDGLEAKHLWSLAQWGDAARLTIVPDNKTEGEKCFKVEFGPEGKQNPPKGLVLEREQSAIDLDSTKKLIVDIYNDGPPFELALVLYTDEFIESATETIKKGLNKDVTFNIHEKDFKSPTSNWQYNYAPRAGTIAWRIMFIMYAEDTEAKGNIYFDNIRVERTPRLT
ncbi:MAG: hypothetical protein PHR22_02600, partial [Candidatus Omnitrophica bacterium]|nr:hypothetical protein [Candidatus Omnitrophota bacterium]